MSNKNSANNLSEFQRALQPYLHEERREMPWRLPKQDGTFDSYNILVSEIMLQQTQVNRVVPKFEQFLNKFPDIQSLAEAELISVLNVWSGLGYNRRAKYLHESAKEVVKNYHGNIPRTLNMLTKLPGIGHNTAAAILVYAFNEPEIFIETNIRTVFIHHFFKRETMVDDKDITPFIVQALGAQSPREFYWALMDYGTYLKSVEGNISNKSRHYIKQSAFQGSGRQLRGKILKMLLDGAIERRQLISRLDDSRATEILQTLIHEGLVEQHGQHCQISS